MIGLYLQEIPLVHEYLTRYDVNKVEFLIHSDKGKVQKDIK